MKKFLMVMAMIVVASSCGDDDGDDIEIIPPRLLAEVATENDEEIKEFLETHFYNYEEFETPPMDFDYKIVIDTIAGDNQDKIPLINQVASAVVNVSSSQLNLREEENDIPHTYYYLSARDGEGIQPTIADSTLLRYEGVLLNGTRFDATPSFLWQELPFFLRGYSNGVAKFKSGTPEGLIVNSDGTSSYSNSGIGMIIMPSGLAYFLSTGPSGTIPSYSNLIFTVEIGNVIENTDRDNDGIPSILEDLNGNGYVLDDNTDAELEANANFEPIVNFQDIDDDGDGVLTRTEISDANGTIIIPYPDSDNDGTPDYLDPDIQWDESEDDN